MPTESEILTRRPDAMKLHLQIFVGVGTRVPKDPVCGRNLTVLFIVASEADRG